MPLSLTLALAATAIYLMLTQAAHAHPLTFSTAFRKTPSMHRQVDSYSFKVCVGTYLRLYREIKPLENYTEGERKFILDWIEYKCGPNPDPLKN